MSVFHIAATVRAQVDTETALQQIAGAIRGRRGTGLAARRLRVQELNDARTSALFAAETAFPQDGSFTVPNMLARVRAACPERTALLNEVPTAMCRG